MPLESHDSRNGTTFFQTSTCFFLVEFNIFNLINATLFNTVGQRGNGKVGVIFPVLASHSGGVWGVGGQL